MYGTLAVYKTRSIRINSNEDKTNERNDAIDKNIEQNRLDLTVDS